tara:strand:+ start:22463 stop:23017 length:555 start_codon:yes stop_codon:yes gene_type:complete
MSGPRGIEPGDQAPEFELPNANPSVGGEMVTLSTASGSSGIVVLFTCNHCPYVVGSESRIEEMAAKARKHKMGFVGINSNDPIMYESDNWESMVKRAGKGMSYSYLHDESQEIAHSYGAERTPEFYLLDAFGKVVYRGRLDDSPRDPSQATTSELSDAIEALGTCKEITTPRTDSIGCSVKWKQ